MPEYLEHRCCMCPQRGSNSRICPGVPGSLHPKASPCRFVKRYRDSFGALCYVRAGIGHDSFKTFYRRRGRTDLVYGGVPWRNSFDEAQADLNAEAKRRGWQEVPTCANS